MEEFRRKLQEACGNMVGKSGDEETWLPLWLHLEDTAGMMRYLFEHYLCDHQKELIYEELRAQGIEDAADTAVRYAKMHGYLHDIGKSASVFQSMMKSKNDRLRFRYGIFPMNTFPSGKQRHHTVLGRLILRNMEYSAQFASITGSHHGTTLTPINSKKVKEYMSGAVYPQLFYGPKKTPKNRDFYRNSWKGISEAALSLCGFQSPGDLPVFSQPVLALFSGLLIYADWASSDMDLYPLIPIESDGSDCSAEIRLERAVQSLNLPDKVKSSSEPPEEFSEMFGFEPNPVQQTVIQAADQPEIPYLFLIEAQMGNGKTEAALYAADRMMKIHKCEGAMFALPTQATANGLMMRFEKWAEKETKGHSASFRLFHGNAKFNEAYQKLFAGSGEVDADGDPKNGLMVHNWFERSKTGLLADYVIGTIDQALLMSLKHRHVLLRHLGLTGKVVIIDEVHAYDAYMNEFFSRMLIWLGYYRVPVILLSATLPSSTRTFLIESYRKGLLRDHYEKNDRQTWMEDISYPKVTCCREDSVECFHPQSETEPKTISVIRTPVSDEDNQQLRIAEILKEELQDGGCAGIILNSVSQAQNLYQMLKRSLSDTHLILFHSRFTVADRSRIEKEVLSSAGKDSTPAQRYKLIVVGTQVLEQSLDLDFDAMITQLAPADMLLQRTGRLHRHEGRTRPARLNDPKCYVLMPTTLDSFLIGQSVYSPFIQEQTAKKLPEMICIPDDIPTLVEKVYSVNVHSLNQWEKKEFNKFCEERMRETQSADNGLIKETNWETELSKMKLDGLMDSDSIKKMEDAANSVRKSNNSEEGVLLTDRNYNDEETLLGLLNKQRIRVPSKYKEHLKSCEETEAMIGYQFPKEFKNTRFLVLDENDPENRGILEYDRENGLAVKEVNL